MKFAISLPAVVLSAIDSAIIGDADSVDDSFDSLLDDNAAVLAADKAARTCRIRDWEDFFGGDA